MNYACSRRLSELESTFIRRGGLQCASCSGRARPGLGDTRLTKSVSANAPKPTREACVLPKAIVKGYEQM
jgi:hypothetical protein